jgi:hypothetical protein
MWKGRARQRSARAKSRIFPFRDFSRLCKAENFPSRGCAAAVEQRSRPSPPTTFANSWIGPGERWSAARRVLHLVGSRLPRPYHFRARIQSFQAVAAPFPGDFGLPSGSRSLRSRRAKRRAFGRPVEPARAKPRFRPDFVSFQGFARRKISLSVAMPISCSARSTRLRRERRCLPSSRAPTLFRLATCGRARAVARSSSLRSERCPRFPKRRLRDPRGEPGVDATTLARIGFLRNTFSPSARTRELC